MLVRLLLATWVGLVLSTAAGAQVAPPACFCQDRPVELPPLLPPPTGDPNAPAPAGPRGPGGEYDHGYLYLPQSAPPSACSPEQCRPLGRWWVDVSVELAWTPKMTGPAAVRLRVPDGLGGSIP